MMRLNLFDSRCNLNLSPIIHLRHVPTTRYQLQPRSLIACQALPSKDNNDDKTNNDMPPPIPPSCSSNTVQVAAPSDSLEADVDDIWSTCKSLTQLWAIVLPLGYAGVPLAAQALSQLPGGPSFAAFGGEALGLTAVLLYLRRKNYELQVKSDLKSISYGFLAGIVALILNQLLFSSGGDDGAAATTATGEVAAVLLSNSNNPAATLALFTASTLLAPATEEIIYRGFFLGSLTRLSGVSAVVAVGASAIAFSAAHFQPEAFLQLTLVGICLGSAAVVSKGNVLAPFIGHATYNTALFLSLLSSASSL
jgi:membrane protease YdiL (CAAX protease family)